MRLDRFIANNSRHSRGDVRHLVKAGRVTINGKRVENCAAQVGSDDRVCLDNNPLLALGPLYYMLHKPAGYLCATRDSHQPTVLDLLAIDGHCPGPGEAPGPARLAELQIAGRLDLDTTGLVLLTSDGDWNHRVTAPRAGCQKVYLVELAEPIDTTTVRVFAEGLRLHGESKATLPAQLEIVDARRARLAITEGKYHQVKRMFAAVGNCVTALHRQSIGAIALDASLKPGEYRALSPREIASVT